MVHEENNSLVTSDDAKSALDILIDLYKMRVQFMQALDLLPQPLHKNAINNQIKYLMGGNKNLINSENQLTKQTKVLITDTIALWKTQGIEMNTQSSDIMPSVELDTDTAHDLVIRDVASALASANASNVQEQQNNANAVRTSPICGKFYL